MFRCMNNEKSNIDLGKCFLSFRHVGDIMFSLNVSHIEKDLKKHWPKGLLTSKEKHCIDPAIESTDALSFNIEERE